MTGWTLKTRRIVARACDELEIPFVHGAIAGFSGELMTIFPGDKGLNDIWGLSPPMKMDAGLTYTGNPAATAAAIAAWEVQEAIKIITGIGTPVRNRLIFLDFADGTFDEISLS